ncbi:MAG: conjugative transposon protein TraM [Cyclobacteriaceae bacterium]|nr:conjugative transposon protein TraM [Cyclobacteriaceae bacterium]
MKPHSEKFLQKRRFFMVLPVLVLPFITMIFWALGGGQGNVVQARSPEYTGLNLSLPDAHFAEKEIWDKLSLYEMAERDSAKYKEARESDPYFDLIAFKSQQELRPVIDTTKKESKLIDSFPNKERTVTDPNEERVNKKLQELYSEINKPSTPPASVTGRQLASNPSYDPQFTADVDRLEKMMEMMHDSREVDPEMQQIESMLEKILDIQHPERVKEKLKSVNAQSKTNTLPVEVAKNDEHISLIGSNSFDAPELTDSAAVFEVFSMLSQNQNGFFGLDDEVYQERETGNGIEAMIHDTQELVAGSTVKIRLLNDIHINGKRIPKDQFIYGICAINGERLTIEISSIRTGNSLLPVSLEVYDLDGLPGIYIPGAITRDAAKQASDNALQNIQLMSLDPSIGTQAAAAGMEAAKGLFSKKAKLVKVTVKAGYQVFLKDTNPSSEY